MSDFVTLGRIEIEQLLPMPAGVMASWEDVLRRATPARRHSRTRVAVVLAAVAVAATLAVATPVRSAIGAAFNDFSAWLAGTPGRPVSSSQQEAFERANARTWAAFAPGTKLRRLLTTNRSGTRFELFGFRSGDDLCVKLVATGSSTGNATRCVPEHALQTAVQPAVVVAVDEPVGGTVGPAGADGYKADAYLATFGIASDGVRQVAVNGDSGPADAVLGGNAFLYVADHPKIGARVRSISAVAGNGRRVALDFEGSPFGNFQLAAPPKGTFHGPKRVQRHLVGGTIGWLQRGEQRGTDVPVSLRRRLSPMISQLTRVSHLAGNGWPRQPVRPIIERELQPDPKDFSRMILIGLSPTSSMRNSDAGICVYSSDGSSIGGGCDAFDRLFGHGPLNIGISGSGPSQYSLVSGTASDDVARIAVYLGTGEVIPAALKDNVFLARVARADYPLRIVAYDRTGKVVSVSNFANDGMTSPAPAAAQRSLRTIERVTGDHGGSATLRAGAPAGGYRCWTISLNSGAEEGGCNKWPISEATSLKLLNTQWSSGDLFLVGQTPHDVAKVSVGFHNGSAQSVNTTDGFVLATLPASLVGGKTTVLELQAYDAAGRELAKRGISIRQ